MKVKTGEKLDETTEMYRDANTKTIFYKTKLGESVAIANVVKTQKVSDFVKAIFTDPAMIELQKLVKENSKRLKEGGSVTVIGTEGSVHKTEPTEVVIDSYTLDTVFKSSYKDKWISYTTEATKEKTKLNFTYMDEMEVVIGREKDSTQSFFKRLLSDKESKVWVTSRSPYSNIVKMKAYQVEETLPSRWSVGLIGGYGITTSNVTPVPILGVGVNYRLFYIGQGKVKK